MLWLTADILMDRAGVTGSYPVSQFDLGSGRFGKGQSTGTEWGECNGWASRDTAWVVNVGGDEERLSRCERQNLGRQQGSTTVQTPVRGKWSERNKKFVGVRMRGSSRFF